MEPTRYAYELQSHWLVAGQIEHVFDVLSDGEGLPRWWPDAYRKVEEVSPGDADGIGRTYSIVTRGLLPYDVVWQLTLVAAERPRMLRVEASGDLIGIGEWQLRQDGGDVALTYDWRVRLTKRWMQRSEFLLRPFFVLNHRWVMRRGEAGLRTELARRNAAAPTAAAPLR